MNREPLTVRLLRQSLALVEQRIMCGTATPKDFDSAASLRLRINLELQRARKAS